MYNENLSAWDKFFLGAFSLLNGYNTKPERTIVWFGLIFSIFTMWITFFGDFSIKNTIIDKVKLENAYIQLSSIPDYGIRFWYSIPYNFTNLVPILKTDRFVGINELAITIGILENIIGILLFAIFLLAIRNRFRRSKEIVDIGGR